MPMYSNNDKITYFIIDTMLFYLFGRAALSAQSDSANRRIDTVFYLIPD